MKGNNPKKKYNKAHKKNYSKYNNYNKDKDYTYKTIYDVDDYNKDVYDYNKSLKENRVDISAFKRLVLSDVLNNTNILTTSTIGGYKLCDISDAMQNRKIGWRTLLAVSESLMRISPHYYRLNSYYSNMATFCWGVDVHGVKDGTSPTKIKDLYFKLTDKLENMNLKHEFTKIMRVLPFRDIFCGLLIESTNGCYIQEIDFRMCKLYEIQDGLFNFAIDLSAIKPTQLDAYPKYIRDAYISYAEGLISSWYLPPADLQICIKFNYQWTYPYPLLIGLVDDLLNLDTYKKLKLQSARTDNYKAIMIKVPIDDSTIDKPLLSPPTLATFAQLNRESMSDDIGILHTLGSDGQVVSFKDSNNLRNYVADALDDIYDASGISQEVFNGSSSITATNISVESDAGFVYGVYRQLERWVNRFIKLRKMNKTFVKFSFYILDITTFNRDTVLTRYKDAIALGIPVIDKYICALDMTPSRIHGSYSTHEDIFDFRNHCIPLQTAYNSSDNDTGRPKSDDKDLSDKGEITRSTGANENRE